MTHLFEGIDFFERRFDRADVRAITSLTDRQLDRWTERRLIPAEDQRPGKGGRRRYHGFEVFALKLMGIFTERFRIPPADAVDLAMIVTKEVIKRSAEVGELMIDRIRPGTGELVRDFAYVMLWYEDGDWRVYSDYQEPPLAPLSMEIRRQCQPHISIPITSLFNWHIADTCERVYGTEWHRKKLLEWPVEDLRRMGPEFLQDHRITEDDLKRLESAKRKPKTRARKRAAKKK